MKIKQQSILGFLMLHMTEPPANDGRPVHPTDFLTEKIIVKRSSAFGIGTGIEFHYEDRTRQGHFIDAVSEYRVKDYDDFSYVLERTDLILNPRKIQ